MYFLQDNCELETLICGLVTTGEYRYTLDFSSCHIHALGQYSVARTKNFFFLPTSHQVQLVHITLWVPIPILQMWVPTTCPAQDSDTNKQMEKYLHFDWMIKELLS